MLPFRWQVSGHLFVTLLLTVLFSFTPRSGPGELERKSVPFTTQSGMLAVTVVLYPDQPPAIVDVQKLDAGRLSLAQPGPYRLALQDKAGQDLYILSFRATFSMPGLGKELEEARQMFVLPAVEGGSQLQVTAPQGEVVFELKQ